MPCKGWALLTGCLWKELQGWGCSHTAGQGLFMSRRTAWAKLSCCVLLTLCTGSRRWWVTLTWNWCSSCSANHGCSATQSLNKLRYKLLGVVHVICMYHSQFVSWRPGGLWHDWRWRISPLPCETLVLAWNYFFSISILSKTSHYIPILCIILLANKWQLLAPVSYLRSSTHVHNRDLFFQRQWSLISTLSPLVLSCFTLVRIPDTVNGKTEIKYMRPRIRLQTKFKTSTELEAGSWVFVECLCFSDPREPKTSTQAAVPKPAPVSCCWWWAAALSADTSVFTKSPFPWHCFCLSNRSPVLPFSPKTDILTPPRWRLMAFQG